MTFKKTVGLLVLSLMFLAFPRIQAQSRADAGTTTQFANLFALRACGTADPEFCPGGVFDEVAFDALYQNPEGNVGHYPGGDMGAYTRHILPLCETGDCGADTLRCTDGTRPVYYYKPGSGADADKWIIKIQGGGDACNAQECAGYYVTTGRDDFSSAYGQNPANRDANGILSTGNNNLFRNFNLVFLDKCVGDRNLGDTVVLDYPYGPLGEGPVYFHGYRIILALLQDLKTGTDLADASLIAFMTQSNGSNGAYLYIDRLRDYVLSDIAAPGPAPDVRFLASSFFLPNPELEYALNGAGAPPAFYPDAFGHADAASNHDTICGNGFDPNNPRYQDWLDAGEQVDGPTKCRHGVGNDHLRGIGGMFFSVADFEFGVEAINKTMWGANDGTPTIDASCLAAHQQTGDPEACNDAMHVLLYHLTTPTFFAAQAADRTLRTIGLATLTVTFDPAQCDAGDPLCHSENYRGDVNESNEPVPSRAGWQKEDFQRRVVAFMTERFLNQSPHQEQPLSPGHGAFIDNTVDHLAFSNMSKLRRTILAVPGTTPVELQGLLYQWFDPSNNLRLICVDDGPLYDVEFAPPVLLPDAPPGLACDSGAYFDPNTPIDPGQTCNDPFSNVASPSFPCLRPPAQPYNAYLPVGRASD